MVCSSVEENTSLHREAGKEGPNAMEGNGICVFYGDAGIQ
jgi:hypothetical protein